MPDTVTMEGIHHFFIGGRNRPCLIGGIAFQWLFFTF